MTLPVSSLRKNVVRDCRDLTTNHLFYSLWVGKTNFERIVAINFSLNYTILHYEPTLLRTET